MSPREMSPREMSPREERLQEERLREKGFSLLELLVTMSLLSLLALMTAGGARFAKAAWDRSAEVAGDAVETRAAQKFLRRLIEGARPIPLRDGSRTPPVLFQGGPDRLLFAASLPAALAPPGEHLVALSIEPPAPGAPEALLLRWRRLTEARPSLAAEDGREVVLADARGLRFRYFDSAPAEGDTGVWREEWRGRRSAPALVGISFARSGAWERFAIRVAQRR